MKNAIILILLAIIGYFLVFPWLFRTLDPIPSLNKGILTQAMSNCRQFSLASGYYITNYGGIPTIKDLIEKDALSEKDAMKLLKPDGAYCIYFSEGELPNKQPRVEYFSERGRAWYSPGGSSGIWERKK